MTTIDGQQSFQFSIKGAAPANNDFIWFPGGYIDTSGATDRIYPASMIVTKVETTTVTGEIRIFNIAPANVDQYGVTDSPYNRAYIGINGFTATDRDPGSTAGSYAHGPYMADDLSSTHPIMALYTAVSVDRPDQVGQITVSAGVGRRYEQTMHCENGIMLDFENAASSDTDLEISVTGLLKMSGFEKFRSLNGNSRSASAVGVVDIV